MAKQPEFRNPIWEQMQQIRVTRDNGIQTPVQADGENGIVIGNPPVGVPPKEHHRHGAGALARLKRRLARI